MVFEPELGRQSGGQHSTTHHQTDVCLVVSAYEPPTPLAWWSGLSELAAWSAQSGRGQYCLLNLKAII